MTRARDISRLLGRTDNEVDSEGQIISTADQIVDSAFVLSQSPASSSFTFYSTLDSLPSNADEGQLAFVEANTRMYLNDGSGWYSVAAVNLSPSLTLSPSGAIELADDGSASTVTITATDTDDPSAILSYSVESDGNMLATGTTVTQDSSVFTITPATESAGGVAGDFTLSFKVSDQIDEAVANKNFSLSFQSIGALTASASSVNEGSTVTFTLAVEGYSDGDTFPYSITGIQAADISQGLTGVLTVSGNSATVNITATADLTTEGAQTMTFTTEGQSVDVTINDTSIPPAVTVQNRGQYVKYNQNGAESVSWNVNTGSLISATGNDCIIVAVGVNCDDDDFTLRFNSGISGLVTSRFGGARYDAGNSRSRVYLMHAFTRTTGVKTITVDISQEGIDACHIGVYRIGASNGISSTVQRKISTNSGFGSRTLSGFNHAADDFVIGAAISYNPWGSWSGTLGSGFAPYTSSSTYATSGTNPSNQGYRYYRSFHYSDINSDITTSSSSNGTVTYSNALEMIAAVFTHN
jgi:hypothetical protein